jgi:hypothetical protein
VDGPADRQSTESDLKQLINTEEVPHLEERPSSPTFQQDQRKKK